MTDAPADSRVPGPACALCQRPGVELTRHHLIPRMRHRNKRVRRRFDRAERAGRVLAVCRACHKQIHALIDEKALAERFNTREALLNHPELARFVAWVRTKPPGFVPTTRSAAGSRRR